MREILVFEPKTIEILEGNHEPVGTVLLFLQLFFSFFEHASTDYMSDNNSRPRAVPFVPQQRSQCRMSS